MSDAETKPVEETPAIEEEPKSEPMSEPKPETKPAETTPATTAEAPESTESTEVAEAESEKPAEEKRQEEAAPTVEEEAATEVTPEPEPEPIEIPAGNGELVLVTGATGFLGSHIIKQLVESGEYRVRGTVRSLQDNEKLDSLKALIENAKYPAEFVEADLKNADSWAEAVKGCDYVIHTARPSPASSTDPSEVIETAKEGTLTVLKACVEAGTVRRVVVTGSLVSIYGGRPVTKEPLTEAAWADNSKITLPSSQSKTIAEQAAWDFMKELPEGSSMELSVINPGFMAGPPLMKMECTSTEIIKKLMHKEWSMIPKIHWPVIDVRDVAQAHMRAMVIKQAAGKRHIAAASTYWLKDVSNFLSQEFSGKGFNISTTQAPYVVSLIQSSFNSSVKQMMPDIGKLYNYDTSRLTDVLQVTPRSAKDAVVEMTHSLINFGIVQKVEKPEKRSRKLTFRKKRAVKEEGEEKKDEPEKIKDNGSAENEPASLEEASPEEVKVEVNGGTTPESEEAVEQEPAVEVKEEAAAATTVEDADKIEAAAASSEEEAKEEKPDPESSKSKDKKEKPKKEKKKGLFSILSFKSKNKKHVEKKTEEKPEEDEAAEAAEAPAASDEAPTTSEKAAAPEETKEETPAATEDTPATTEKTPATVEETPAATEETPATTEETPAATEETPAATEETPAEETPTATEEAPVATEETKAEETPAATEDKPEETKTEENTSKTTGSEAKADDDATTTE